MCSKQTMLVSKCAPAGTSGSLFTWFVFNGMKDAAAASRGSQAGDPLGDIVVIVAFTRVTPTTRERL